MEEKEDVAVFEGYRRTEQKKGGEMVKTRRDPGGFYKCVCVCVHASSLTGDRC